jgi:endonuclease/exonuclease/phosphatase family metal-dependent hydrolase
MRFVLYNIRYGTGSQWHYHFPLPFSGYFRPTVENLHRIASFLASVEPDIIGLVEVDNGSYRSAKTNQAEHIAAELGFDHVYENKYASHTLPGNVPLLREQGNAFITNQGINAQDFHYFQQGVKRLVIELELDTCVLFLVHLSLYYRHRQYQLGDLYSLFREQEKPVIVAGDFNALWGDRELDLFLAASGLKNANAEGVPTFPSRQPKRQLDFILHSPSITVNHFEVPKVMYSDHLPIVCDFDVKG